MSGKLLIMAGLALTFGATSYVAGNHYLESQTQARVSALESERPVVKEIELSKVVVATSELRFGQIVEADALKLVDWPQDAIPKGVFSSISDVVLDGERRTVAAIQPGEPVLEAKLTGKDGRAGLAGIISQGMRAVTIPVNTINGVGGFVQPGDRVDLVLTSEDDDTGETRAKIMMENVKVLSVDQEAGSRNETARIAKSVTLETDSTGARNIALALSRGRISLLLRSASEAEAGHEVQNDFLSLLDSKPKTKSVKIVEGRSVTNFTVSIESQRDDAREKGKSE